MALIACPDCGRDVSDLAPVCPGCGRPLTATRTPPPGGPAPAAGGILKGNVSAEPQPSVAPPQARASSRPASPLALVLGGLLLLVLGAGAAVVWSSTQPRQVSSVGQNPPAAAATRPGQPQAPVAAVSQRAPSTASAGALPDINGISCDALESTIVHLHVHLAIFVDGEEQQIPFGVGIGQPWQVSDSDQGPFVDDGACFYWIHTHTEDGVVHIESPVRRRFTLGDFFAIWQMALSTTQVGPAQGQVIAYVNGQRSATDPAEIPLLSHERIQLDVGTDVPPYQFDFPPGD
ncbi:MAG TPA: hypothetical protein VF937_07930 [Chloroflexota bacterium]